MVNKYLLILIFFTISFSIFSSVENGLIDLSNYNFTIEEPVNLSGLWDLTLENGQKIYSEVPGSWETGKGSVKYSLKIISSGADSLIISLPQINTEYEFYLNNILIVKDLQRRALYIPITLKKGTNALDFYVTNTTEVFGGFRSTPYIGSFDKLMKKHEKNILRDTLISGASFIMFLFFFILFINYRNEKSTLYFSFICLFLTISGLVTNDRIIFKYLPNTSYLIINKIEYFSIFVLPLFILLFVYHYYEKRILKQLYKIFITIGYCFCLIVLFTKPSFYISVLYTFYVYFFVSGMLVIITLLHYCKEKEEDSFKILISILSLFFAGLFDALNLIISFFDYQILPSAMIIFIMFISFIISQRELKKLKKIDILTNENIKFIDYLRKFVPDAFIKTVGMGNITTISKGDGVDKEMTVLFTTIIGFKEELKLYRAEDTVQLLNRCYQIISPVISAHGGFIDKFMDETVMALFPGKPEDALDAVLDITKKLEVFNKTLGSEKPIKMRSAMHIGSQYIGIVGDKHRVDATVISHVVNTASRINSFTKKIERNILISEDIYNSLSNADNYTTMYMGRVKLKGKMNFIGIYCLYADKLNETDKLFSATMKKLENSSLDKIENVLLSIKKINRRHRPTNYYLELIKKNKNLEDFEK